MLAPSGLGRVSQRQPSTKSSSRIGPTCPSFSEYRTGQSRPASSSISQRSSRATGMSAIAPTTQPMSSGRPDPDTDGPEQRERHEGHGERGRVEEDREPAGHVHGGVVERLSIEQSLGRLGVGLVVVAERPADPAAVEDRKRRQGEHGDGDRRQERSRPGHVRCRPA